MSVPTSTSGRVLTPEERDGLTSCVREAQASGEVRWLARVVEAEGSGVLECYARAEDQDRFFWQRAEAGDLFCALGAVDEIESDGPGRFADIRKWSASLSKRMDWIGANRSSRSETSPVYLGGFGFENEMASSPHWKAFPAARFVLPKFIVEQREENETTVGGKGGSRWVHFVRVEPGAPASAVESELLGRFDEVLTMSSSTGDGIGEDCSRDLGRAGEVGPEYIVRADRRHSVFEAQVRRAIQEIEEGGLAKVVLARSLSVDHDVPFDVPAFLARLRDLYPSCTLVAIGRGKDTFLAATPERLVRVAGCEVESAALAGSAPRGRHPEEDQAFAAALLGSEKENEEHAYVVASIRGVVEVLCDDFECSATPELRRLVGIQHLETRLRGRLRLESDGQKVTDVLGLVEALHPTPAVGGLPATEAMAWLKHFERLDRGWYASPVGWLDQSGGGDFRVALRSALIRNGLGPTGESGASHAILFAGAGIVAGSEPERELVETRIKLRALLAPMTEI